MTENLKIGVSVHLLNPSGFVAQKSRPETNLPAALAEGDGKQMFFVRFNDKENMLFGGSNNRNDVSALARRVPGTPNAGRDTRPLLKGVGEGGRLGEVESRGDLYQGDIGLGQELLR